MEEESTSMEELYINSNRGKLHFINSEEEKLEKQIWSKYVDKHIMYFGTIEIKKKILCVISYTCDFIETLQLLKTKHQNNFRIISFKLVRSFEDVVEFTNLLKIKFEGLGVKTQLGIYDHENYDYVFESKGIDKYDTFSFDLEIYKEFENYIEKVKFTDSEISAEINAAKNIDYLILQEKNRHFEAMENKELQLQEITLKLKQIELKLSELQNK